MNTVTRLASVLALCVALPACDDEKDIIADSASTGSSDTESEGTSETGAGTETEADGSESGGASETGVGAEQECNAEYVYVGRPCDGGTEFCFQNEADEFAWGACVTTPACVPGTVNGCMTCEVDKNGVPFIFDDCPQGESTPLVLSFDGAPVEYGSAGKPFDLGICAATDWPTARTPWLALDRDRSGHIDGGSELFGSATRLRSGSLADNGFTALTELDADHDGKITAADPKFAELVLWADGDADRRSSGLELQPLAALGLVAIELGYSSDRRCDARANCEVERASFVWRDGLGREQTGEVIDVHLACQ